MKHSVSRRIDYITQTLRNNNVKDTNYKIHQLISPASNSQYKMVGEVVAEFEEVLALEKTINWLVEKLENTVKISEPTFHHSEGALSDLRRKASLNALHNCRSKALAMAQLLNQSLGCAVLVQEEEVKEYSGVGEEANKNDFSHSIQQRIDNSTITVHVKIHAVFECALRTKKGTRQ